MRQVPYYLIIGRGRLARHFAYYFALENIDHSIWHRGLTLDKLYESAKRVSHILILINDDAIDAFCAAHLQAMPDAYLIHCSGHLTSSYAIGAHPLMTFGNAYYTREVYRSIPFVLEEGSSAFSELFPELTNRHVSIPMHMKAKYHALCALSGNLTCYLWQQLFARFETEFDFPKEIAFPYLKQQMLNLVEDAAHALTGPLSRNDQASIATHLSVLQNDHLQAIYAAFIRSYYIEKEQQQ